MSFREMIDNARRKGKKAYWDGVPLSQNPMRGADSKRFWEIGWRAEKKEDEARHTVKRSRRALR